MHPRERNPRTRPRRSPTPHSGTPSDAEPARELGIGVSHPRMGEREQGRPALSRRRREPITCRCCRGRVARKRRAELDTSMGRQAGEASGGDGSLGRKPIYQGLHHVVSPTTELPGQVGTNSVRVERFRRTSSTDVPASGRARRGSGSYLSLPGRSRVSPCAPCRLRIRCKADFGSRAAA